MSSMLYTMGIALDRAAENGFPVSLLVEGRWIDGQVAAHDGVGVVIEGADGVHSVVRYERIAAVQVRSASPYKASLSGGHDGARPMPSARCASV